MRGIKTRRRWRQLIQILTIGYSCLGRTFAYVGIIPLNIFIGEIVLGWFMLTRQDGFTFFFRKAPRTRTIELIRLSMLMFLAYGVFLLAYGYMTHQPIFQALQNLAFNYYSLYLVIGVWVATQNPPFMKKFALSLGWIHGVYGAIWILLLNKFEIAVPGREDVMLFGQPNAAAVCIIALLAYEPRIRRIWFPCLLNLFVMLGVQVRSEWLGFIAAFAVWSFLSKRVAQFAAFTGIAITLMAIGLFFDLRMQGVSGRGGEISVQGVVGRMLSPFDPALASKYVDDADALGGTAEWRQKWWREIWNSINHTDSTHFFFGHGYGYPIADLSGYVEEGVRTPHNIFFYSLAYGGWCGAAVFAFFQLTLVWGLYRVYRMTGRAFGIGIWIINITMALLGNSLETPFGAIPFYLLMGLSLRPLFEHPLVRMHNQMLERGEEAMPSTRRKPRAVPVGVAVPRTAVR